MNAYGRKLEHYLMQREEPVTGHCIRPHSPITTKLTNCQGIEQLPVRTRLQKALSKEHNGKLGFLKNNDGNYIETVEDTLKIFLAHTSRDKNSVKKVI